LKNIILSLLFTSLLLIISPLTSSQKINSNYTTTHLAKRITKKCDSDSLKALAIYNWITNNIRYDVKAYEKSLNRNWSWKKVIRRRKGLCEDYALVFQNLAKLSGLEVLKISGYTKSGDYFKGKEHYFSDHAWNLVKIDSNWRIIESTWGSGGTYYQHTIYQIIAGKLLGKVYLPKLHFKQKSNPLYFFPNPIEHAQVAFPLIYEMQVLKCPLELNTFEKEDTNAYKIHLEKYLQNDTCMLFNNYLNELKRESNNQVDLKIVDKVIECNIRNDEHIFSSKYSELLNLIEMRNDNLKKSKAVLIDIDTEIKHYTESIPLHYKPLQSDIKSNLDQHLEYNKLRKKTIIDHVTNQYNTFKKYNSSTNSNYKSYKTNIPKLKYDYKIALKRIDTRLPSHCIGVKRTKKTNHELLEQIIKYEATIKKNDSLIFKLKSQSNSYGDSLLLIRNKEIKLFELEFNSLEFLSSSANLRTQFNANRMPLENITSFQSVSKIVFDSLIIIYTTKEELRKKVTSRYAKSQLRILKSEERHISKNIKLLSKIKKISAKDLNEDQRAENYFRDLYFARKGISDYNLSLLNNASFYLKNEKIEIKKLTYLLKKLGTEIQLENLRYEQYYNFENVYHRNLNKMIEGQSKYTAYIKNKTNKELKTLNKLGNENSLKNLTLKKI
jgi:hypothetical protein